jgi:hypothetical protein
MKYFKKVEAQEVIVSGLAVLAFFHDTLQDSFYSKPLSSFITNRIGENQGLSNSPVLLVLRLIFSRASSAARLRRIYFRDLQFNSELSI